MDDAFDYATEPHCGGCGTVMRFADGAYRCGACGTAERIAGAPRPSSADDLPGIAGA